MCYPRIIKREETAARTADTRAEQKRKHFNIMGGFTMNNDEIRTTVCAEIAPLMRVGIHYSLKDHSAIKHISIDHDEAAADIITTLAAIRTGNYKATSHIFSHGNGKLDRSILTQAIIPIASCGKYCDGCYAANACVGAHGRNVSLAWFRWYFIEKYFPDEYFALANYELDHTKATRARLHVSGDFLSADDFERWCDAIRRHPAIQFYTYSKRPTMASAAVPENLNIIDSVPCGRFNFGDDEYIEALKSEIESKYGIDAHICECGGDAEREYNKSHGGRKFCGHACTACFEHKYVLFHIHN